MRRVLLQYKGRFEQARRKCLDRERWRLFCCGLRLVGHSQEGWSVRGIDIDRKAIHSQSFYCQYGLHKGQCIGYLFRPVGRANFWGVTWADGEPDGANAGSQGAYTPKYF